MRTIKTNISEYFALKRNVFNLLSYTKTSRLIRLAFFVHRRVLIATEFFECQCLSSMYRHFYCFCVTDNCSVPSMNSKKKCMKMKAKCLLCRRGFLFATLAPNYRYNWLEFTWKANNVKYNILQSCWQRIQLIFLQLFWHATYIFNLACRVISHSIWNFNCMIIFSCSRKWWLAFERKWCFKKKTECIDCQYRYCNLCQQKKSSILYLGGCNIGFLSQDSN